MQLLERLLLDPRVAAKVATRLRTAHARPGSDLPRDAVKPLAPMCKLDSGLMMVFLPRDTL